MKVNAIVSFMDRYTGEMYAPGAILEWDDADRIADCVARGLVEAIPEKAEPAKKTRTKKQ